MSVPQPKRTIYNLREVVPPAVFGSVEMEQTDGMWVAYVLDPPSNETWDEV